MTITLNIELGHPARDSKGKSLLKLPADYCAIDTETTGLSPTFDHIIELAACRVVNGAIVDRYSSLISFPGSLDPFITDLTGITQDMLAGAPSLSSALAAFRDFIGDSVLVAHHAQFDINFLYDNFMEVFDAPLKNDFVDTMRIARRILPKLEHHRLCDVVEHYGIEQKESHRALGDAQAASECLEAMRADMAARGISLASLKPSATVSTDKTEFDESHPLYGSVVAFTGTLERMPRKDAMQLVADLGGTPADNVTKKTNYLVLGNNDYCKSIKDGKSNKQKKAEKLKLEGVDIEVIPENVFYDMVAD